MLLTIELCVAWRPRVAGEANGPVNQPAPGDQTTAHRARRNKRLPAGRRKWLCWCATLGSTVIILFVIIGLQHCMMVVWPPKALTAAEFMPHCVTTIVPELIPFGKPATPLC
ncbi:MAG: hypothetical protein WA040_03185 [Anaerolineae bacterium]